MAHVDPLQDLTRCSICLSEFRDPKALPCLHGFCKNCLESLVSQTRTSRGTIQCPICRQVCKVPNGGVSKLPTFHLLVTIQDALKSRESKDTPSTINKCEIHRDHILLLYCRQCKVRICIKCIYPQHRCHEITNGEEGETEDTNGVSEDPDYLMRLTTSCAERREELDKLSSCEASVRNCMVECRALVDQAYELRQAQMEDERTLLHEEINNFAVQKLSRLQSCKQERIESLSSMENALSMVEDFDASIAQEMSGIRTEVMTEIVNILKNPLTPLPEVGQLSFRSTVNLSFPRTRLVGHLDVGGEFGLNQSPSLIMTYIRNEGGVRDLVIDDEGGVIATIGGEHGKVFHHSGINRPSTTEFSGTNNLQWPFGVTLTSNDNIAISDYSRMDIKIFDQNGSIVEVVNSGIGRPNGVAELGTGDIAVCYRDESCVRVFRQTDDGGYSLFSVIQSDDEENSFALVYPMYVSAWKHNGMVLTDSVSQSVVALQYESSGWVMQWVYRYENGNAFDPLGISTDSSHNVYVADQFNGRVLMLSPTGQLLRELVTPAHGLENPSSVSVQPNGNHIAVGELNRGIIKVFKYK